VCRELKEVVVFKKRFRAKSQSHKARRKEKLGSFFAPCCSPLRLCVTLFFLVVITLAGCEREKRQFSAPPATFKSYDVTMSDIHPGTPGMPQPVNNPSDNHAFDANEGKRLYTQYNCSGCHFNGGGGIGPPLMDEKWIYGDRPENIYSTIVEGRPNGMPSFRQKIPDNQLQQIVAYVRSMSGQLRKDVAPTRNDDMNAHRSEQRTERKTPQQTTAPPQ
jgi:cytochrome c oxidase cbb3-type subunit 3